MKVVSKRASKAILVGKPFLGFAIVSFALFLVSCEDPGILKGDQNFSKSSLRSVFVDTFSVVTSTILVDSLPTTGTGQLMLGGYQDAFLGKVSASTYFQVGYSGSFAPDQNSSFDSIGLVLPYSKYFYGDTTKAQTIKIHQMTSIPRLRTPLPYRTDANVSFFVAASQAAIYNSSQASFNPIPITTVSVKFSPRRDSLYIKLPAAFGKNWFDLAQADAIAGTSTSYFKDPNSFISDFFNGLHLTTDAATGGSVVGFKSSRVKIRLYYKKLFGDLLQQTYFDFPIRNASAQFNSIQSDRSATPLAALTGRSSISSSLTGNTTFIQSGIGLATKVEFPSLKSFFSKKNFILIDASLEIVPVQNTYSTSLRVPNSLALFITDQSNVVLNRAPAVDRSGYLSANILYDFEYGVNTKYSFPLVNFLGSELVSGLNTITPLVIAVAPPAYFAEVNRVVLGDQRNLQHKIKLKINYSYVQN
ncbi:MAG: DUF4270 family protein [Cytophagales bacterium]|nr:DUF4270 family protein [Cytophagales bacterium]